MGPEAVVHLPERLPGNGLQPFRDPRREWLGVGEDSLIQFATGVVGEPTVERRLLDRVEQFDIVSVGELIA